MTQEFARDVLASSPESLTPDQANSKRLMLGHSAQPETPHCGVEELADIQPEPLSFTQELKEIKENIDTLARDFQGKLKYDAAKQQIIDKLHDEVQEYRNNMVQKLLQPFVLDAIQIIDDLRKITAYNKNMPSHELDAEKLLKILEDAPESLEDLLYRQGVDSFESHEPVFDPKRQKALERVVTNDINLDKTIAKRLRKGYEWEGRVVRPELVTVYVYTNS